MSSSTPSVPIPFWINLILYIISSIIMGVQFMVFASLGLRLLNVQALMFVTFVGVTMELLVFLYIAANPATIFDDSIPIPGWVTMLQALYMGMSATFTFILSSLLIQLWASIYSRAYLIHIEYYQKWMVAISISLGLAFTVAYLSKCENYCLLYPFLWGGLIGLGILTFVGPFFLGHVTWGLIRHRLECQKLLTRSSLSLTLYYRVVFALIVIVILSIFNLILYINSEKNVLFLFTASSKVQFDANSLTGIFTGIVYGTSNESLDVIANFVNRKFGTTWRQGLKSGHTQSGMMSSVNANETAISMKRAPASTTQMGKKSASNSNE